MVIVGDLSTLNALPYLYAAAHMHASEGSNQCSQAAPFVYSSRTVGVVYVHRRLSNTMSMCTGWVCARLNTSLSMMQAMCPGHGYIVLILAHKVSLGSPSIL